MADSNDRELNAQALAASLWRNAGFLVLAAAAVSIATFFALSFVEPLYTADTGILIEERESPLTRTSGSQPPSASEFDESAIQSQVEVLRSREIAEIVVDELGLGRNPEFDPAARPSRLSAFLVSIGLKQDPAEASVRQRAMDAYAERLSVYPLGKSRVVGVDFTASSPELAANVANAVADAYIRLQQDAKRESAVAATAWLEQEIERLRGRVAEAEDKVAKYRTNAGLFDVGTQGGSLSTQQLGDINAELARAKAARSEAEARAALVESLLEQDGALESSQEVLDSQLIQRLSERQVALRSEIADLSVALLPGHPRIRALQSQLTDLRDQIRQEAQKVLRSLNTAARVAAAREASLIENLNEAKRTASRSNEQEIELRALEREAAAQRDLLETFLARYREAAARTDANYLPADARIISRAVPPGTPSFPKKGMMSVAAGVAALLAGIALLTMREFLTGRAYQPLVLSQRQADAPELRMITSSPNWSDLDDLDELETPLAPTGSDFLDDETDDGHLGTGEIAEILASPAVRMVLFAGALGGEGAGEIALSSARQAAENDIRFVILDLGLLPSEALGGNEEPGLGDLLNGDAAFGEVIRRDEGSRVHLIPMGTRTGEPAPERLALVLGALTHTYDKVIVVADSLDDWPYEHVRPDLCALVCGPETTDEMRSELYDRALSKGAKAALIVRFSGDNGTGEPSESEAA